jgi:hypothetical protein
MTNPSFYLVTVAEQQPPAKPLCTTTNPEAQSDLNREIARACFTRCDGRTFFDPAPFRDAARLMGRTFTPETTARLSALCTVDFDKMPAPAFAWLDLLRTEILA